MSYDDFDLNKARELREKAKAPFTRQIRKAFLSAIFSTAPFVVLACFASIKWAANIESGLSPVYLGLYLCGLLFIFLIWAFYRLNVQLVFLLKEMKQLRWDFLAARDEPAELASGDAESFSMWPVKAVRPSVIALLLIGVFVVLPLATAFAYSSAQSYMHQHRSEFDQFGAQEMVDLHVTVDGRVRAFSRISITKCDGNVMMVPIQLSQPGAVLESVTVDGRKVVYMPEPGKEGMYRIMSGLPENALKNALLEVIWSLPAADIVGKCSWFQLRGLLPLNAYSVNISIDEGAPYRFDGKDAAQKSCWLFWTKYPVGQYNSNGIGSCGVSIVPVQ